MSQSNTVQDSWWIKVVLEATVHDHLLVIHFRDLQAKIPSQTKVMVPASILYRDIHSRAVVCEPFPGGHSSRG